MLTLCLPVCIHTDSNTRISTADGRETQEPKNDNIVAIGTNGMKFGEKAVCETRSKLGARVSNGKKKTRFSFIIASFFPKSRSFSFACLPDRFYNSSSSSCPPSFLALTLAEGTERASTEEEVFPNLIKVKYKSSLGNTSSNLLPLRMYTFSFFPSSIPSAHTTRRLSLQILSQYMRILQYTQLTRLYYTHVKLDTKKLLAFQLHTFRKCSQEAKVFAILCTRWAFFSVLRVEQEENEKKEIVEHKIFRCKKLFLIYGGARYEANVEKYQKIYISFAYIYTWKGRTYSYVYCNYFLLIRMNTRVVELHSRILAR